MIQHIYVHEKPMLNFLNKIINLLNIFQDGTFSNPESKFPISSDGESEKNKNVHKGLRKEGRSWAFTVSFKRISCNLNFSPLY